MSVVYSRQLCSVINLLIHHQIYIAKSNNCYRASPGLSCHEYTSQALFKAHTPSRSYLRYVRPSKLYFKNTSPRTSTLRLLPTPVGLLVPACPGGTPLLPPPFGPVPDRGTRRRPVPVPVTGVRYNNLL